jgi:hypothetical protein
MNQFAKLTVKLLLLSSATDSTNTVSGFTVRSLYNGLVGLESGDIPSAAQLSATTHHRTKRSARHHRLKLAQLSAQASRFDEDDDTFDPASLLQTAHQATAKAKGTYQIQEVDIENYNN